MARDLMDTRLVSLLRIEQLTDNGPGVVVEAEAGEILLVMCRGEVHAFDNTCTHRDIWLDHARVCPDTEELECPWHLGRFDLRTGAATCAPCVTALTRYPVVVEDGEVLIQLPTPAQARS